MDRDERLEELTATWGPGPTDPIERSVWLFGLEALVDIPEMVAELVEREGTDHPTLADAFNSLLPRIQAEVTWLVLQHNQLDDVSGATKEILKDELWQLALHGVSPTKRTRLAQALTDDVWNNIMRVILANPYLRGWLLNW